MASSAQHGSKTRSKTRCSKVCCSLLGTVKIPCHVVAVTGSSIWFQIALAQRRRLTDTVLLSLWAPPTTSTPSSVRGDFVAARCMSWQREQTADATLVERSWSWLTQRCSPTSRSHKEISSKETRSRSPLFDTLAACCGAPCRSRPREQFWRFLEFSVHGTKSNAP